MYINILLLCLQQAKQDGTESDGSYDEDDDEDDDDDDVCDEGEDGELNSDSEDDCLVHITSSTGRRNLEWDDSTLSF